MKTIWKWTLQPEIEIEMPAGAEILTVQQQHGEPQVWAVVDPNAERVHRKFTVYGTGHRLPDNPGKYIGTFQIQDGILAWHVFDG